MAKQIFSKRSELNLFIKGHQEGSFSIKSLCCAPEKSAFAWGEGSTFHGK